MEYFAGATGPDTAFLTAEAVSRINGIDSVIGTGNLAIPPCATWTQVTDSIIYPLDNTDLVDTLRIIFTSGGGGSTAAVDSSILYVDDVTYMWKTQTAVPNVFKNDLVKVYPNPSSGTIYFDCPLYNGLGYKLYTMAGQTAISDHLSGHDAVDVSGLSGGLYFYTISDEAGNILQRGKVSIVR